MVRSESCERSVDTDIKLCPEPVSPSSASDEGQGRDGVKKGSKRIFPLYDNFSRSVKRHREKSREREKSRDRVKQRDRLKLKEEEQRVNGENGTNSTTEKAGTVDGLVDDERGRDKVKEKKRFYQRDKSKEKKKNKDKVRNGKEVDETQPELRRTDTKDSSRPSSTYSCREELIYGKVERQGSQLAISTEAPVSIAPASVQTLDLFISSKTTPHARLCASISTPSFSEFSERSVDVPRLTACYTATPSTSQPWINPSGNVDYSAVYGGLPGCRRGLYESPLGKYGSPTGRYFTLERSGVRRPSEHEYETFEAVLTETAMKSVVESERTKNIEKQDVENTARSAENGTSHSSDEKLCTAKQHDFCVSTEENPAASQSQSPNFTKAQSTPEQQSGVTSPDDCVTSDDVTSEALSALGAPGASSAVVEQEGQTAGQSASSVATTRPDTVLRSVSVPAEASAVAGESPPAVSLTQADSAVVDRHCTAPQAAGAQPAAQRSDSVVQSALDDTTAAPEPAADKARSSRKFLSFHSRVVGGSGGKASAKRSFLSNLLRPDGGSSELSVERTTTQDGTKVRSLPAKYRDFFRDKKTDRLERFAETVEVVTPPKSVVNADKKKDSVTAKSGDPEVVEIELPGVFGQSQMRASLRITLKNHSDSSATSEKCAASKEASNGVSHRSGGLAGDPPAVRRSTRSRSRSQPRRTADQRMSIAIPPATVAALTNKFNALIQATSAESSPSPTGTKTFNLGSIALDKSGNVSKSASFRRTDGMRCSARRRQASERAEKQSRETTEALVNRASDVLSREIAGLLQARTVSGGDGASGSRSGPGSFRTGKGGDSGAAGAAKESCSAVSSRAASFRRTRANGVGAGVVRESSRVSSRRRPGDVRSGSSRNIGWTSAVRAEQKKNAAAKCSSSLVSDKPSDVHQATNSTPEKRNATSLKSETQPSPEKRAPSNSSLDASAKARNPQPVNISSKCSRLQDIPNAQNAPKKEDEKLTQTAGLRALATKPADWPKRKNEDDARKTAALAGDVKSSSLNKPGRQSVDVSRVYDRELRKITNTGTVAKASELWLKRAQSGNEVNTFKKKTATLTPSSQRPPSITADSKVMEKALSLSDINQKSSTSTDINKPSGSFSSLSTKGPKQKLASDGTCAQDTKKDSLEKSETESTEKSSTNTAFAKIELRGYSLKEPKDANNAGKPSADVSPKETKQTAEDVKWSGAAKHNLLENRLYGATSICGPQKRTTPSMFENKLYGATFTPIKDTINKYVTVAAQSGSRQPDSKTLGRNTHAPACKSLSLKSLPAGSPVSRVKEAIHRFEVPSPTNSTSTKSPTDETALKSTTLPSRLPTSGGGPSIRCIGPDMSRNPHCPDAERSHGFYETLWNGRREYKPNESFLWHGCSQLTSGGESPGSVASSISNSDRDTASSLSDASSAADEDAAARGRGSLWRRLGLTRAAPAAQLPNPAGEYEPTGGSSSSGTVTYENGSDPGYERISGDSCVGYEQIGSAISGSNRYERIGEPPPSEATSAGYETLAPPSEASTLCYDDCVVPARLAVVNEHQTESLNYLDSGSAQYEDIGGVWSSKSAKDVRAPHEHLKPTPLQTCEEEHEEAEGSEGGPQTVNSYQLTEFGGGDDQVAAPAGQQTSLPSTPRARTASDRDTAGEWTDIDADGEQEASDDTEDGTQSPLVITRPHFVRMRNRSRRFSKTRTGRRSWSQSMRNLNSLNSEQEQLQLEGPWRHTLTAEDAALCVSMMLNFTRTMPENLSRPLPPPRPPKLATSASSRSFDGHPRKLHAPPKLVPELYASPSDAIKAGAPPRVTSSAVTSSPPLRLAPKPRPPPLPPKPVLPRQSTWPAPNCVNAASKAAAASDDKDVKVVVNKAAGVPASPAVLLEKELQDDVGPNPPNGANSEPMCCSSVADGSTADMCSSREDDVKTSLNCAVREHLDSGCPSPDGFAASPEPPLQAGSDKSMSSESSQDIYGSLSVLSPVERVLMEGTFGDTKSRTLPHLASGGSVDSANGGSPDDVAKSDRSGAASPAVQRSFLTPEGRSLSAPGISLVPPRRPPPVAKHSLPGPTSQARHCRGRRSLATDDLPSLAEASPEPPPRPASAAAFRRVSPVPPLRPGSSTSSLNSSTDTPGRHATPKKPRMPDPPAEEESVYVSSGTSVIYIGNESSHDPSDYDDPYVPGGGYAVRRRRARLARHNSTVIRQRCTEDSGAELQELSVWMDQEGGETDEEWLEDSHLYEALDSHYEPVEAVPEAVDSDDAADDDEKELGDEDLDQDQHTNGMQKIAQGMRRRLQKTKSDIRSGIIRFRKSTSTGAESPVSVGIKPRWLLKKHLPRAKKSPSSPGADSKFYLDLDLVIQPRAGEEPRPAAEEEADAHSESDMGSARSSVRRSDTGSLSSLQQTDSRVRLPSTQSSSSQNSAASATATATATASTMRKTSRPRNSPPAPPAPPPAAAANSPHPALPPDTSASPGFVRALSAEPQPPARSLSACRQSAIDADVAPPLPPPAARGIRPPSIPHQVSCGELSDRVSRPRLERSAASVGSVMTSLGDLTYAAGHDNTEYMLAAESDKPGEDVDEEEPYTSLREREPLYQVYLRDRCYQESISGESEDDYETIQEDTLDADSDVMVTSSTGVETAESSPPPLPPPPLRKRVTSRPSALQLLSSPTEGQRSLWCQLPEVIASGLLEKMSSEKKRLQEAMFEVMSSEASYQKSLSVLVRHFQGDPALCQFQSPDCVLKKADFQDLFSNAEKVRQSSEAFLTDLERRWQEDVTLSGLCEVLHRHAHTHFHVYKQYCANQTVQDRKLKELREKNPAFLEVLRRLESCPQCQSLSLHSFLMLPMQRVTRLPLLVSAILVRLEPGHPEYTSCQQAYQTVTQLAKDCDEEARRHERLEELVSISRLLVFKDTKQFPLVKPSRWLVKKGELLRTVYKAEDSKMTFGRKQSKQQTVWVFLFNDLLIISKKKSDESYVVLDWCLRNMVQLTENAEDRADRFLLTLLSNHEGRTVEMLFSCQVESERVRWVEAVTPQTQKTETETVYESWDCPQVQAMHPYMAQQPDEITLHVGDVLKVLRKMPDGSAFPPAGWYQGMRLSDSASGWFPSNHCREIMSEHVKARHLRQRYQLLQLTGDYLRQERERKMKGPEKESAKGGSPASERAVIS